MRSGATVRSRAGAWLLALSCVIGSSAERAVAQAAQSAHATQPTPSAQAGGADHLVIVSGLSGEERFAREWLSWGSGLVDVAGKSWGMGPRNIVWLAEDSTAHTSIRGRSTRAALERELRALAGRVGSGSRVLIVLFGHGSYQAGESRINLPGPDVTAADLGSLLDGLAPAHVAVVNTTSASGGFIGDLARENRIVITATRSGMESNETVFGRYFTAALTSNAADTDQDGRVSLLEAYVYARAEVAREYQRDGRLLTEHAVLDAVGDARGVSDVEASSAHGRAAHAFRFGGAAALAADASPELRALYQDKERIEAALDALRARRDAMPESRYEEELESLLLELSRNAQSIRRIEGGSDR